MKQIAIACFLIGILSAMNLRADWFDDTVQDRPAKPPAGSATTRPVDAQFVIGGCNATVVKSLEQAVDSIQKQMDQLAASGDTAEYDALNDTLERYQSLLKKTKESPAPPSIYPLALGKKGSLFVVRKTKAPAGTPSKPSTLDIQFVSWLTVKVLGVKQDQSLDAEVLDAVSSRSLYKVVIEGLPNTLKAGTVVQLINMQFECVMEERADNGKVYYLKKL